MEQRQLLILILVPSCVSAMVLVSVAIYCCCTRKGRGPRDSEEASGFEANREREGEEVLIKFEDNGGDLSVYEILDAPGEVIGKSSYGTLYRATLLTTNRVTLLRFLRPAATLPVKQVVPLMELLGSLRHQNLVPLSAFYAGPRGEKLMLHPFYPHGTLAQFITESQLYKWHTLCRISIGIARGLAYLHTGLEFPIIHGNLKSNNVLLDGHLRPYVSDFGLHLLLNPTAGQEMLQASAAQGYRAPELIKMKDVCEETDIYNFGIILLELVTGREASTVDLPRAIQSAILDHSARDFYHPQIQSEEHIFEFLELGMACCCPSPPLRPTINQVLTRLQQIAS